MYYDTECPYCKGDLDICNDDGFGLNESETYEYECPHCQKTFVFTMDFSINYYPKKADCLNGAEHTWKAQQRFAFPDFKFCTVCDRQVRGEAEPFEVARARAEREFKEYKERNNLL